MHPGPAAPLQQQWAHPQQAHGYPPQAQFQPHAAPMQQPFGRPSGGHDFNGIVELRCILTSERELRRALPAFIFMFVFATIVASVIAGMMIPNPFVYFTIGAVIGGVITLAVRSNTKARLDRTYRDMQRLQLSPAGLRRTDGNIATEMAWSQIERLQVMNSALQSAGVRGGGVAAGLANGAISASQTRVAAGIVGCARLTPLPGASRKQLQAQDRLSGRNLARGEAHIAPQGLIFPSEFEADWMSGTVGAWLRHYRPDIQFPA